MVSSVQSQIVERIIRSCVPDRRPSVLVQILLVLRMKQPHATRRHFAQLIIVNAKMIHAPVGQLIGIMQLEIVIER